MFVESIGTLVATVELVTGAVEEDTVSVTGMGEHGRRTEQEDTSVAREDGSEEKMGPARMSLVTVVRPMGW